MNLSQFKKLLNISGVTSTPTTGSSSVITGTGAPTGTVGNGGDTYIDKSANLVYPSKGAGGTTPVGFFGINTHFNYPLQYASTTAAQYVSIFQDLGVQIVRTNCSSVASVTSAMPKIQACIAAGIQVLVVIDQAPILTNTYAQNYPLGQTLGHDIAAALLGSGVTLIECTNEIDYSCKINGASPFDGLVADGSIPQDYTSSKFEAWRGYVAGMIAGIKSVSTTFQCGFASGQAFPAVAADMLINGKDTTGTVSKTPMVLDFVGVHWYNTEGTITAATSSHNGSTNSLQALKNLNNIPIYVTEWGIRGSAASNASYITSQSALWWTYRSTYNIKAVFLYQLFTETGNTLDNNFSLYDTDFTQRAGYAAFKTFNNANTVTSVGGWPAVPRFLPLAPIASGVAIPNTGNLSDNTLVTVPIPGGSMGPNSVLRITTLWTFPNNANTKTLRVKFGGVNFFQGSYTANTAVEAEKLIRNRNSLTSQVGFVAGAPGPTSASSAIVTAAIDTSVTQNVVISAQCGVATDTIQLEGYLIEIIG